MRLRSEVSDKQIRIWIEGHLGFDEAQALRHTIQGMLGWQYTADLYLELTGVPGMDAEVVLELLHIQSLARAGGRQLFVCNPSLPVCHTLLASAGWGRLQVCAGAEA